METQTQKKKIDLAVGNNLHEGFTGVDISKNTQADVIHDLDIFPWPFEDVEEIMCSHYAEHTTDLIAFMNECYRILKPGARMTIISPYYTSIRCWQDPTHKRAISEATFFYYCKEWRVRNKLEFYPITADFKIIDIKYTRNNDYFYMPEETIRKEAKHHWNVYDDIIVTLEKQ